MPANDPPFRSWHKYGLPAFAAALAPWQDKFTKAQLIAEAFQAHVSTISCVVSPFLCFLTWAICRRLGHRSHMLVAVLGALAFIAGIGLNLWLYEAVDSTYFPEDQSAFHFEWQALYVATFAAFGIAMVGGMLVADMKQPAGRAPAKKRPSRRASGPG